MGCGGPTRAPGGVCLLPGCETSRDWGLLHAQLPVFGACGWGLLPTGFWCGLCGPGDPAPTLQHAVGAARRRKGGGVLPVCGSSGSGRSPMPDCRSLGRAAGARYPLAVSAGGCGPGNPSPTSERALLQTGFARCGGGTRAPRGGCLLPACGASGVRRSPMPNRPSLGRAVGARYPLAGGAGV